jgi:hyperosmotically inducible periplasmic protein
MLKIRKKGRFGLVVIALLTIGIVGLAACQSPGGRTAGEVVDDSTLATRVKTALFRDPDLSGFAIEVDVFNGEVTLTGGVDSQQKKEHAGNIVSEISGVRKVNNLITVQAD